MFQAMPFERPAEDRNASAGFTLIEALVALAVAAVCLTAIGSLMAGNIRGSGRIEQHLGLVETLRAVETGLPIERAFRPELSPAKCTAKLGPSISCLFRAISLTRARPNSGHPKRSSSRCNRRPERCFKLRPYGLPERPASDEKPAHVRPLRRVRGGWLHPIRSTYRDRPDGHAPRDYLPRSRRSGCGAGRRASTACKVPICSVSASTGSSPILPRRNSCRWAARTRGLSSTGQRRR